MNVTGVLSEELDSVWDSVTGFLQSSIDRSDGNYLLEDIRSLLLEKKMQLWIAGEDGVINMAAITEVVDYPQKSYCVISFLGGDHMSKWLDLFFPYIEAWSRDEGLDGIYTGGRRGWEKVLKKHGYEFNATMLKLGV